MTAIVAVHTPEGYILAADGRQRQGTITNDETTKILPRLSNLWVNIVGLSAGSVLSKLKRPVFVATRFVGF
jgi:20S proteasome alpha/beta subunit